MPIEYTHTQLEALLGPELARFQIRQDGCGWVARDAANDESIRASSREELIRRIAIASDIVDLSERPTFNGRRVLVAEVLADGGQYRWVVYDAAGKEYASQVPHAEMDAALLALNDGYDDR